MFVEFFYFFSSAVPLTSFAFRLLGRLLLWSDSFSREGDVASTYVKPTRCYFKESSRFQSPLLLLHCFSVKSVSTSDVVSVSSCSKWPS